MTNSTNAQSQYVHPKPSGSGHILSLLPTVPPTEKLAIGTSSSIPPTTDSFASNPQFLDIVNDVLRVHAVEDPWIQSQALAFATSAGSWISPQQTLNQRSKKQRGEGGGGGASAQGGAGGGGRGGYIHISDLRAPPDYGRIAWPEDIFGSLEVDGSGKFVEEKGNYQPSGSYRIITRDGILGLTDYLRGKLVERLREEEAKEKR